MTKIQVWRFAMPCWQIAYDDIYDDEQEARQEARRRAIHERHPYRVINADTGREIGRFTGEF